MGPGKRYPSVSKWRVSHEKLETPEDQQVVGDIVVTNCVLIRKCEGGGEGAGEEHDYGLRLMPSAGLISPYVFVAPNKNIALSPRAPLRHTYKRARTHGGLRVLRRNRKIAAR